MSKSAIEAVVLDLDDTLWPIAPVINRAERALAGWIRENVPHVAGQWDVNTLKLLRASLVAENPALKNDVMGLRRGTIAAAFAEAGGTPAQAEAAFEYFRGERNKVEFYPDVMPALDRLASRFRLAVISNGFADLRAIGIGERFESVVSAHEVGTAKPDPRIFAACIERMNLPPSAMIYAGDDPANDVVALRSAGMRSAWINRLGRDWPEEHQEHGEPEHAFASLAEFADWMIDVHS